MLNKSKGQMYPWVTHTWNPIKGICPHACSYCYYQADPRFKDKIGPLRLDEKALKDNLGKDRTIFVGSSTDMWATEVPIEWIRAVLSHCQEFPDNTYLFQSKNPYRFLGEAYKRGFPPKIILGTTLETNREIPQISKAPDPESRVAWIALMSSPIISLEPILDFDLDKFLEWLKYVNPLFVSIGADSKNHNLPEPPPEKIKELIFELKKFTEVKIKKNLSRLLL